MIQSKSIFPTGQFNIHIDAYVRRVICYLSLEGRTSHLGQKNKMATLQSNISQAISEQHDFVGKIISDRRKVRIYFFFFMLVILVTLTTACTDFPKYSE